LTETSRPLLSELRFRVFKLNSALISERLFYVSFYE